MADKIGYSQEIEASGGPIPVRYKEIAPGVYAPLAAADVTGMTPVGNHETVATASLATAETPTVPATADRVLVQALGGNIRYTLSGTTPTAGSGFQLRDGDPPTLIVLAGGTLKFIREASGATIERQWGK